MMKPGVVLAMALMTVGMCAQSIRPNAGFRTNSVPRNDDGSSDVTPLGFTINFFGKLRSSCWVNNNGNLTFDDALSTYTPFGLQKTAREIIAPFFADVDTRPPGSKLVTFGADTVNGHKAFGANYIDVGYFGLHDDKLNSFQVVLIDRSETGAGNFDIEFNYARIVWETGDASGGVGGYGGVPASVGWSNGTADEGTSYELPGSLVAGAFLDNGPRSLVHQHLNATVNGNPVSGRLTFRARDGMISPGLSLSGALFPDATMGSPYSSALQAGGAKPPFRWALLPDVAPPAGLSLTPAGVLSGTPTATGTYSFTIGVTATTEDGDQTVYQRGSITIRPPSLSIATGCPLNEAMAGSPYSVLLNARGSGSGYTWSVEDPYTLPPGMGLSPTGLLAGTPLLPGNYAFLLRARSNGADGSEPAQKLCRLQVTPAAVQLVSGCTMPSGTVSVPYSQWLIPAGGVGPYRFQLAGQLPAGLSLSPDGRISGLPSVNATYPFTVSIADSRGAILRQDCSITVNDAPFSPPAACPLPGGTTGAPYNVKLPGSYTWSLAGGTLPAGLSLSPDGVVSGTPMDAGAVQFRLLAADGSGNQAGQACSLSVVRGPLSFSGCPLPAGSLGVDYASQLDPVGGAAPHLFTVSGSLPPGVSLSRSGLVNGRPATPGDFAFAVKVTDGGGQSITQPCSLKVAAPALRLATACPLPNARMGESYSTQVAAKGGTAPYRFEFLGYLPEGLSGSGDGTLSGTPLSVGATSFVLQVTDAQNQAVTSVCSLAVALPALPEIRIADMAGTVAPASASASIGVELSQPYSLPVQGQVNLNLTPDTYSAEGSANQPDPRLRFANGQTSARFTIAAGATKAVLPLVSTGTVASTVAVSLSNLRAGGVDLPLYPTPRTFRIAAAPPAITAACYTRAGSGIEVQLSGYSTTRELARAELTVGSTILRTDLRGIATEYFGADDSIRNGGAFSLKVPYDLGLFGTTPVGPVSLNLFNAIGAAGSRSVPVCQ